MMPVCEVVPAWLGGVGWHRWWCPCVGERAGWAGWRRWAGGGTPRVRFPSWVLRRTGMFTGKLPSWLSRRPGPLVARRYPPPGSESEAPRRAPGPQARGLKSIIRSHVSAALGPLEVSLATSPSVTPSPRFSGWPRCLLFKHKSQFSILSLLVVAHWHGQAPGPGTQAAEGPGVIVTVTVPDWQPEQHDSEPNPSRDDQRHVVGCVCQWAALLGCNCTRHRRDRRPRHWQALPGLLG
jgi:hypothetical protein